MSSFGNASRGWANDNSDGETVPALERQEDFFVTIASLYGYGSSFSNSARRTRHAEQ